MLNTTQNDPYFWLLDNSIHPTSNQTIIMQAPLQQISAQPGYRSTYLVSPSGSLTLLSKTRRSSVNVSLALQQLFSPSYIPPQTIQQDSSIQLIKQQEDVKVAVKCKCKKSRCLKNYCDCYYAGTACGAECGCLGCQNVHGNFRRERNATERMGCMCSKSGCMKRYCACHSVGRKCAWYCRCTNCENMGEGGSEEKQMEVYEVCEEPMFQEKEVEDDFLSIEPYNLPAKRQRKPTKPQ